MKNATAMVTVPNKSLGNHGGGRKKHQWAKNESNRIKRLVLLGLSQEVIAQCIGENGMDSEAMRECYSKELITYKNEMLGKIAGSIFQQALEEKDGGLKGIARDQRQRMQMFVMKTRAGWRENDQTVINAQNVQIVKRIIGVDEGDL